MVCQVCGKKSGFFPLCKACNKLKVEGKVAKCQECGIWEKRKKDKPFCYECWKRLEKNKEKKSKSYKPSESEKVENDFRKKFPADKLTSDGHWVRSKAEQLIDNWLYGQRIAHAYEKKVPIKEDLYCDFYIPFGDVYIEYWGLDTEEYVKRREIKKKIYKKHDLKLIELVGKDDERLDDILPMKLREHLGEDYKFV